MAAGDGSLNNCSRWRVSRIAAGRSMSGLLWPPMSFLDEVSIRGMTAADIPAGLAFCRASGWNQTRQDWQHFLTAAPDGALVAVKDQVVIGTVTTAPYGPFTWLAMVLVAPEARSKGVGTLLFDRGLDLVGDEAAARLDATPAGEAIYRARGFVAEYPLARLFLDSRPARPTRSRQHDR